MHPVSVTVVKGQSNAQLGKAKVGMGGLISKMLQPQGGSGTTPQKRQRDDETPEKSIKGGAKKSKENKE